MIKNFFKKKASVLIAGILMLLLSANLAACTGKTENVQTSSTKEITDMAGRKVTIPSKINKIYTESPVGQTFIYTLDSKKLAGLNYELTDGEKKYTDSYYNSLPLLSGNFGQGKTMNKEAILKVKPDIVLSMGDINDTAKSNADKMQEQLGIPVVLVTGDLDKQGKAYEFVGGLIEETEKAKELSDYCKKTYADIKAIADKIPEDKKVKVYYAEGENGLQTDPKGSSHSTVLDLVGGINIADVKVTQGYGRTQVSMEQLLKWNPDIIIVCSDTGNSNHDASLYQELITDPKWSNINAVKNRKIFQIPYLPFNWFDRPPSVSRILGMEWLGNLLYPDYFKIDIKKETLYFYDKFYHIKLSDDQYKEIMINAQ